MLDFAFIPMDQSAQTKNITRQQVIAEEIVNSSSWSHITTLSPVSSTNTGCAGKLCDRRSHRSKEERADRARSWPNFRRNSRGSIASVKRGRPKLSVQVQLQRGGRGATEQHRDAERCGFASGRPFCERFGEAVAYGDGCAILTSSPGARKGSFDVMNK